MSSERKKGFLKLINDKTIIKNEFLEERDVFRLMNKGKIKQQKHISHIKKSFWNEKEAKRLFQELPFYNTFIKKPSIKQVRNIDLLHDLPFYNELNIAKISEAFKRYVKSCKIEIKDSKDPFVQLETNKSRIEDLLKGLLDEIKSFKYQLMVKVLLSKHKENRDIEFSPVYFNSTITLMHNDYSLAPEKLEISHNMMSN